VGRSVEHVGDLPPGQPLAARFLRGLRMTDVDGKCGCTVRIDERVLARERSEGDEGGGFLTQPRTPSAANECE
jgi:hypothetical protein